MADRFVINCEAQAILALQRAAVSAEALGLHRDAEQARAAASNALLASGITDPEAEAERYVPLTPAETTARTADQTAAATAQAAVDVLTGNELTLRERADVALTNLIAGANAIKNGNLFTDRTVNERGYLELLGRTDAALIRLLLRKLDGTD